MKCETSSSFKDLQTPCVCQMAPVHMGLSPARVGGGAGATAARHPHIAVQLITHTVPISPQKNKGFCSSPTSNMALTALTWCWKSAWKSSSSSHLATQGAIWVFSCSTYSSRGTPKFHFSTWKKHRSACPKKGGSDPGLYKLQHTG